MTREGKRVIAGLVVPFHTPGRMKLGHVADAVVSWAPGRITWADDVTRVKLLREHDQTGEVLGYAVQLIETERGIEGEFYLSPGFAGDMALLEVSSKLRDAFSPGVEVDDATRRKLAPFSQVDARGVLREVSLVSVPAYDDARARVI